MITGSRRGWTGSAKRFPRLELRHSRGHGEDGSYLEIKPTWFECSECEPRENPAQQRQITSKPLLGEGMVRPGTEFAVPRDVSVHLLLKGL